MKKYYFTFGQAHTHLVNKVFYDKDCVIEIEAETSEEARARMIEVFGIKWAFQYHKLPEMQLFPKGTYKI